MPSTKTFKDFVLEQLSSLDNIVCKPMMGEYLLYYKGVLFGGLYDDRLLIKITDSNRKHDLKQEIPYKNAKPMWGIDDLENPEKLKDIIETTYSDLSKKKT